MAVLIGRGIRLADQHEATGRPAGSNFTVHTVAASAAAPTVSSSRPERRRVPLPPVGIALVAVGLALEFTGFLLRLSGAQTQTARLLSMDAPLSVPRMYISALFAVAAVTAFG